MSLPPLTILGASPLIVALPRPYWQRARLKPAQAAGTAMLTVSGTLPENVDVIGGDGDAAMGRCRSQQRSGTVINRFRDDAAVTAVTIYGHPEPHEVAGQIGKAVHATVHLADQFQSPFESANLQFVQRTNCRGPNLNDAAPLDLANRANGIAATLSVLGSDGACMSTAVDSASWWGNRQVPLPRTLRARRADDMGVLGSGYAIWATTVVCNTDVTTARTIARIHVAQPDGRWQVNDLEGLGFGQATARLRLRLPLRNADLPPTVLLAAVAKSQLATRVDTPHASR